MSKKTLNIDWLSNCDNCNFTIAEVETDEGTETYLYEGDTVTCPNCGHAGVIQCMDEEAVDAIWDEVITDGQ